MSWKYAGEGVAGKKVKSFKYAYNGLDHLYTLTLDDGTILSWGYERCQGSTKLNGKELDE